MHRPDPSPLSPARALAEPRSPGIRITVSATLREISAYEIATLLQVLARHGAICIVDQPVDALALHEFAARWGEVLVLTPGLALASQEPGLPSVTRIGNLRPDGSIIPDVRYAEYWHHDGDFWPRGQNFIVNFLSSVRVPAIGGNTGLLDCRRGYAHLSHADRITLSDASICVRASEISDFVHASPAELPPDVRHPVLLDHPLTAETALYLPDSRTGIESSAGEFICPVHELVTRLERELGFTEHRWREGELLVLDNLQVMHRSMGGYGNHPRLLFRCQARIRPARAHSVQVPPEAVDSAN